MSLTISRTPLKVRSAQSKVGKLQPKSSTFIFAEDEHKHIREYITHELSEIPKLNGNFYYIFVKLPFVMNSMISLFLSWRFEYLAKCCLMKYI